MKQSIRCPHCRQKYKVGHRVIGRTITCERCGDPFIATARPSESPLAGSHGSGTGRYAEVAALADADFDQLLSDSSLPELSSPEGKAYASLGGPQRLSRVRRGEPSESDLRMRRWGGGMVWFSLIGLVLPLVGLQWALLAWMQDFQTIALILLAAVGSTLLLLSWRTDLLKGIGIASATFGAALVVSVVGSTVLSDDGGEVAESPESESIASSGMRIRATDVIGPPMRADAPLPTTELDMMRESAQLSTEMLALLRGVRDRETASRAAPRWAELDGRRGALFKLASQLEGAWSTGTSKAEIREREAMERQVAANALQIRAEIERIRSIEGALEILQPAGQ